jgi:hypothetical protein
VFHNVAIIEYREAALGTVVRVGKASEVQRAEAESEARQQALAAERALDSVLADSFPASDPPSWTLGITRPQPDAPATSDETALSQDGRAAIDKENVLDVSASD